VSLSKQAEKVMQHPKQYTLIRATGHAIALFFLSTKTSTSSLDVGLLFINKVECKSSFDLELFIVMPDLMLAVNIMNMEETICTIVLPLLFYAFY